MFSLQKTRDNELKDWFIECIKTIKKDVAYRKNTGYQFDLNTINSIEQFKMVDKLRLLEKFMENENLLVWMYEKIFPTRMMEVKEYLSQKHFNEIEHMNPSENQDSFSRMNLVELEPES